MSDEKLTEDDCTCAGLVSCNYHYPWLNPPTVTISRECADYLKDTLNWVEESGIGDWGSLDAKRLSELTKAMEVQGE